MNKKLIALAVAGACVAPAAMAQTANPVTLYGRVYVTLESIEAKGAAPAPRRTRVQDQSSYLGVKGTEDLGGGLKAFFQLETGFKPDQNDTTFAARNSAVGLQGGWGSVMIGRWDMPFKTTTIAVDPFGDLTIGGITMANNDQGNFDRRDQNVIQYWSPSWGGVALRLALQANEGKTATINPYDTGASITYTGGPIYAGYAYEKHKDQVAAAATDGSTETGHAIFGNFTFGAFKIGALVERFKKSGPVAVARTDRKSWMANLVWTLGNNQFIYQRQDSKDGGLRTATAQPECDVDTLAYQYNFSRRTFFLAQYSRVDNNAVANCGSAGSGFGAPAAGVVSTGSDPRGISLGIRHIF
jgi:predicted porin